jgi:type IV secretory pathway TraG/TraD family ATPase VirD4
MNHAQKHVAGQVTAFLWSIAWPLLLGAAFGVGVIWFLQRRRLAWTWTLFGYPATYCLWFVDRRIGVIFLAASIMATYLGLTIHGELTQAGGEEARAARQRRGPIRLLSSTLRRRRGRSARRFTPEGLAIGPARGGRVHRIPFGLGDGVHGLVAGATGSGKTVTQAAIAEAYVDAGLAAIVIDPKGDGALRSTLEAAARRGGVAFRSWSPTGPTVYNPLGRGGPTEIVDKALSAHQWSEPHYELATQRLLGHVLATMQAVGEWPPTLSGVVANMDTEVLDAKADKAGGGLAERVSSYVDSRTSKSSADLGGGRDRLAVLVESELGPYLDPSLGDGEVLDLHRSLGAGEVLYFHLDADRYPAASKLLAAALMIDLVGLTSEARHSQLGALLVIDEFAALAAEQVSRLFARARSAGLSLLLGTQSLADLRGARPDDSSDTLTEQVLSNVEFTLAHRIGDPDSAERLARLAGTVPSWTTTHRTSGHLMPMQTGEGTRTRAREFLIGPDEFKRLGTGEAVAIQPRAKHPAEIISVWPPRRGEG